MAARLSDAQILKLIRAAVRGEGRFTVRPHAAEEMLKDGFDDPDVRNALSHGWVTRREPNMQGEEAITVEGPAIDQPKKRVGVVCKLLEYR